MSRKIVFVMLGLVLSLMVTVTALAAAPAEGIIVEGESVPGIVLGFSRAQVEAAYGPPASYCHGPSASFCKFLTDDGKSIFLHYRGADGGEVNDAPDDVVFAVTSYDDDWTTTAGVNPPLALADPDAVIAAYPDAEATYNQWGAIVRVEDVRQGIRINWEHDFYGGFTNVSIQIFFPREPAPPPDMVHVADIEMTVDRRSVTARVLVLNDQDQPIEGAVVDATWTYPKVDSLQVSGATASDGYATFKIDKARRGTYYFSINDVTLDGYVYDYIHSTTLGVALKLK
ncbi:MAG: Ig-like domain-containing protein [Chloroflexota bacterium]|jgi:hypothetical protein